MRNKSLCLFYDWFGTTIWLKSSDHIHTHKQREQENLLIRSRWLCYMFCLSAPHLAAGMLAVLSIPWRQREQQHSYGNLAPTGAGTVVAAKVSTLWELAPTPAGKADNPRWGAAAPTWASAWRRRQVAPTARTTFKAAGRAERERERCAAMSVSARQAAL